MTLLTPLRLPLPGPVHGSSGSAAPPCLTHLSNTFQFGLKTHSRLHPFGEVLPRGPDPALLGDPSVQAPIGTVHPTSGVLQAPRLAQGLAQGRPPPGTPHKHEESGSRRNGEAAARGLDTQLQWGHGQPGNRSGMTRTE